MRQNELQHYGVKGMKWGIRRTPEELGHVRSQDSPYRSTPRKLIEKGAKLKSELAETIIGKDVTRSQVIPRRHISKETSLKKGDKVQHISGVPFSKVQPGQLYVSANAKDNAMYEAYLGAKLKRAGFDPKRVVLELKTDLKAPSSKGQYKMFKEFVKSNRAQVESDIRKWLINKGKDPDVRSDLKELYDQFINSVETTSESQKQFYSMLRRKGYNAVLDEHDITGSWMQAERPLIIMDTMNTIGSVTVSDLDVKDFQVALDKLIRS